MIVFLCLVALASQVSAHCKGPACGPMVLMQWFVQPNPKPLVDWTALVLSGSDLYKKEEVTQGCWSAMEQCAATTMTRGSCKSTYGAMQLDWCRNDVNVDCKAGPVDFRADLELFFDANGDDQTCLNEWADRRVSYDGYTRAFAESEWEFFVGRALGDGACIQKANIGDFPTSDLKTQFSNDQVTRLVAFCNKGNNMKSNRDCLGLPVVCRDLRPDLPACKDFYSWDINTRSLKDKLDMQQAATDTNQDGISTADEVANAILDDYDRNKDGCADEADWVSRWNTYYGFSVEFGSASFNTLNSDGDNCGNIVDVNRVIGNGTESSFFPNILLQVIIDMCEATPSLYETNTDCAQVVDTCFKYFPENPGCQVYFNQCGAKKYQDCVQLLPLKGECTKPLDRTEVHLERLRMENQITPGCVDHVEACRLQKEAKEHVFRVLGMH